MNRTKFLMILFAITFSFLASGKSYVTPMLMEEAKLEIDDKYTITVNTNGVRLSNAEPVVFQANVSTAGTLAEVIGDKLLEIDGIEVIGPINDADFNTLWQSTFNGRLKSINLEKAVIANGIIPNQAFFHKDDQVDWNTMYIYSTWLEDLILPEGVTEIGEFAVAYTINFKSIKLPSTLKKIGKSAFTNCTKLSLEEFTLPVGLEHIEYQAFYQCRFLNEELKLPNGLKSIMGAAFYQTRLGKTNFPESLEYIGAMAFAGCKLKSIYIPDDCWLEWVGAQFYNNWELTEAHLPENSRFIPKGLFDGCMSLEIVNTPQNIERIGEGAFTDCAISDIQLPETLNRIDEGAFAACRNLISIVLPSSLTTIESHAFVICTGLESIYCKAITPPECIAGEYGSSTIDPFPDTNKSIPLCVPVGTKEAYMAAPGWKTFTNIIETDKFPTAGVDNVVIDIKTEDGSTYDLNGRKVNNLTPGKIYIRNGRKFLSTSENNL